MCGFFFSYFMEHNCNRGFWSESLMFKEGKVMDCTSGSLGHDVDEEDIKVF